MTASPPFRTPLRHSHCSGRHSWCVCVGQVVITDGCVWSKIYYETCDVAVMSQNSIAVKIVLTSGKTAVSLIGLHHMRRSTAAHLFHAPVYQLEEREGISFDELQIKLNNACFDTCNVMFGTHVGGATRLTQRYANLIANKCANHTSALAAVHSLNAVPFFKNHVIMLMECLGKQIAASAKKKGLISPRMPRMALTRRRHHGRAGLAGPVGLFRAIAGKQLQAWDLDDETYCEAIKGSKWHLEGCLADPTQFAPNMPGKNAQLNWKRLGSNSTQCTCGPINGLRTTTNCCWRRWYLSTTNTSKTTTWCVRSTPCSEAGSARSTDRSRGRVWGVPLSRRAALSVFT